MDRGLALGFKIRTDQGVMGLLQSRIKDCTSWLSRVSKTVGASVCEPTEADRQEELQPPSADAPQEMSALEPTVQSLLLAEPVPNEGHRCPPTSLEVTQSLLTEASSLAVDMGKQELRMYAAWWECRARQLLEMKAPDSLGRTQSVQLKGLLTELSRGQISNFVDKQLLTTAKARSKEQQGWMRR